MAETGHDQRPIGLIAGHGHLPFLCARGIRSANRQVACVGLYGHHDKQLARECDRFGRAGVAQLGRWIRLFHRWQVRDVVMVGRVNKATMYRPTSMLAAIPDLRAARLWYRVMRHDRRTDFLLNAVADELAREDIALIDSRSYIPEHLADEGPMTSRRPTADQQADIAFGLPLVRQIGVMDIGQGIAVKQREVIAVEAMEGTDAMIRRAGEICRSGRWVMIKVSKPIQDMRFDVPAIGQTTIEHLHEAGAACLAVEAGKTILVDKPKVIAAADRLGIAVVGVPDSESEQER